MWGAGTNNSHQEFVVARIGTVVVNSDRRLKDNITTVPNALEVVNNMRGVEWDWKKGGKHAAGVIAQEVEMLAPWIVNKGPKHKDLDFKDGYFSVQYNCLWAYMIEAVKEQSKLIFALQEDLANLKK